MYAPIKRPWAREGRGRYLCLCINICMYTHIYIYMYIYIHMHTYICIYTYIYIYIYTSFVIISLQELRNIWSSILLILVSYVEIL
jgi:hypothetical protein